MSRYRRSLAGSTYFFTVVAHRRRPLFCNPAIRSTLSQAIRFVRDIRPFVIDAWILLPDHMHCIWTLPEGDTDYSTRWATIKSYVSSNSAPTLNDAALSTSSRQKKRESTIWQRRFWGYVQCASEWPHSTFHRYVRGGVYAKDWVGRPGSQIC